MGSPQQRHRVLAGISRSRLFTVLGRSARPMGVRELADAVGLHPNTVRQHLDQLVEAGLAVRDTAPPIGRGRPALRYAAEPGSDEQDPAAYRALAGVLAEQVALLPDGVGAARKAGERWGRALAHEVTDTAPATNAIGRLVELLDAAGFAPEAPVADGGPIRLRHCPFGTLVREHGEVVCGVHLGLMRGVLRELDAPFDTLRLEPFVGPSLCLAYLGGRSGG
jgi:predicted ArsR family transcriptional regulator